MSSIVSKVDPSSVILEMLRIFPDGLVPISAVYALVTLSLPVMVFSLSMVEAIVVFKFLQSMSGYLGIFSGVGWSGNTTNNLCRSGFDSGSAVSFKSLSLFQAGSFNSPFPSAHMYMLSTAVSYVFMSINLLSSELQALGPNWASRWWISLIFCTFLLLLMICFRAAFSCDSISIIMLSTILGLLTGYALIRQNIHFWGKPGINLIGTPIMEKRGANGEPIYLCQVQKGTAS